MEHSVSPSIPATTSYLTLPLIFQNIDPVRVSQLRECLSSLLYEEWRHSHDKRLIHHFAVGKAPPAAIQLAAERTNIPVSVWMDIVVRRDFTVFTTKHYACVVDAGGPFDIWTADGISTGFGPEVPISKLATRQIFERANADLCARMEMIGIKDKDRD